MKIRSIASSFSHARDDYIFEPSENPLSTFFLFPFFYLLRKVLNRDSIRGANYAPWSAAVTDVHRKSALCRGSFESLTVHHKKRKTI